MMAPGSPAPPSARPASWRGNPLQACASEAPAEAADESLFAAGGSGGAAAVSGNPVATPPDEDDLGTFAGVRAALGSFSDDARPRGFSGPTAAPPRRNSAGTAEAPADSLLGAVFSAPGYCSLEHVLTFEVDKENPKRSSGPQKRLLQFNFRRAFLVTSDKGTVTNAFAFRELASCTPDIGAGDNTRRLRLVFAPGRDGGSSVAEDTVEWLVTFRSDEELLTGEHLLFCALNGAPLVRTISTAIERNLWYVSDRVVACGELVRVMPLRRTLRFCVLVPGKLLLFPPPADKERPIGRPALALALLRGTVPPPNEYDEIVVQPLSHAPIKFRVAPDSPVDSIKKWWDAFQEAIVSTS